MTTPLSGIIDILAGILSDLSGKEPEEERGKAAKIIYAVLAIIIIFVVFKAYTFFRKK